MNLPTNARVRVYRNLRRGDWSVQFHGRVIAHRKYIALSDVVFIVHKSGVRRALESGHKNVHAFIEGIYVPRGVMGASACDGVLPVRVRYVLGKGFQAQSPFDGPIQGGMGAILNKHGLSLAYTH